MSPPPEASPTRVATWGLRHDHAWWVLPQVIACTDVELVAVGGERPDLLSRARSLLGAVHNTYLDLNEMLDREAPDALVALAPNNEHLEIASLCAARSIDLYTHKPMATNIPDAIEFERLVTESGIVTVINTYPLFRPELRTFFERLPEVGRVRKFVAMSGIPGPHGLRVLTKDYEDWLYNPEAHGGGALADSGTYGLLYAVLALGKPSSVTASVVSRKPVDNRGVDDDCWILLEFENATAFVHGSWCMPFKQGQELIVAGDEGQLRTFNDQVWFRPPDTAGVSGVPLEAGIPFDPEPPQAPHRNGFEYFVDRIRRRVPVEPPFGPRVHVIVQELVDAAYESATVGARVELRA